MPGSHHPPARPPQRIRAPQRATTPRQPRQTGRGRAPQAPRQARAPRSATLPFLAACGALILLVTAALTLASALPSLPTLFSQNTATEQVGERSDGQRPTLALDMTGYDPAHLLDDAVLNDTTTLDVAGIQEVINRWGSGCQAGTDGTPCLSQATFDVDAVAATTTCPQGVAGGQGLSAASVIDQVA